MPGDTITVSALGDDPDGDALEYRFFDMYAGGEITESGEVGYLSPQRIHTKNPARANTAYKVMVVAHDGKGGTARAYIAIAVGEQDTKVYCFAEEGQVTANGQPVPVGTQRQVSEGDVIETSASGLGLSPGRALLNYRGGSQLQVAPGSRLKMGSEGAFLHLEKGGLHGDVPSSVKDVAPTFTTPSAIGTVKGTEFEVTVAEDGATVFRVFDGLVNVSDPDLSKTISLHAGQTTTCQPGSVPADAQPFDHASVDRWWEEAAPPSPAQPGDGNADGRCTEVDALMALKMAVGVQPPDAAQLDVNGDGLVTEVDALQILQWAVKGGHCGGA
jgi:hypothetical protein